VTDERLNVPNAIAALRLFVSPGLVLLGRAGEGGLFLGLFLFMELLDWLDGKIAQRLEQQTTFGARLDTVADLVMYAGLVAGLTHLESAAFLAEWPWLAPAVGGYVASWLLSFWKFGTLPSYHTLSAKASWLAVVVAAVALLLFDEPRPLRVAGAAVTLTNLEAILLTLLLREPRSDVPSVLPFLTGKEER